MSETVTRVLITGAAGEVGRGVVPLLERHFSLGLLDRRPPPDDPRWLTADVLDLPMLLTAMAGCNAVLHLAVASGHPGPYEDDAFNDLRFDVNVKGTYHVLEAARRTGVRRVVLVSSLMVVWGHGASGLVPGDAPPQPVGTYALTKALAEEVGRYFAVAHGLDVVVLRIAAPLAVEGVNLVGRRVRPQQVPIPDLAQAFARALTVPLSGFHVVTIVGESSRRAWDLGPARRLLGYEPQYRLDDLGVVFGDPFDVAP